MKLLSVSNFITGNIEGRFSPADIQTMYTYFIGYSNIFRPKFTTYFRNYMCGTWVCVSLDAFFLQSEPTTT